MLVILAFVSALPPGSNKLDQCLRENIFVAGQMSFSTNLFFQSSRCCQLRHGFFRRFKTDTSLFLFFFVPRAQARLSVLYLVVCAGTQKSVQKRLRWSDQTRGHMTTTNMQRSSIPRTAPRTWENLRQIGSRSRPRLAPVQTRSENHRCNLQPENSGLQKDTIFKEQHCDREVFICHRSILRYISKSMTSSTTLRRNN